MKRRTFVKGTLGITAISGLLRNPLLCAAEPASGALQAGQGVVDTTPPLGIEMGGFHYTPGNERRIRAIRHPTAARALVLQHAGAEVAILSLDLAGVSDEVARRIQQRVATETGIPAQHVRVCVTHTHSMPAFCYLRQWGAIPVDYLAAMETHAVEAVKRARADLAPAALRIGQSRAVGGNFNRTTRDYHTDEQFDQQSSDQRRWLDTQVHVLHFERSAGKGNLLWYHFSAHPVCFADDAAGPDWPALVDQRLKDELSLTASYLQGHAGDVNPGDGNPWRGDAEKTATAVHAAIQRALADLQRVDVSSLRCNSTAFGVPLDIELFRRWLKQYHDDPANCASNQWVDAGFAQDWYEGNAQRDVTGAQLPITLSVLQIGSVAMAFHPSELYSYYGLAIQRASAAPQTIVVGYTDGLIGYLADPRAYAAGEYAAMVVPKILDFPPFTPAAAAAMTEAIVELLQRTVA